MLNPISITAPILNGEGAINVVVVMICFIVSIGISAWFIRSIWGN